MAPAPSPPASVQRCSAAWPAASNRGIRNSSWQLPRALPSGCGSWSKKRAWGGGSAARGRERRAAAGEPQGRLRLRSRPARPARPRAAATYCAHASCHGARVWAQQRGVPACGASHGDVLRPPQKGGVPLLPAPRAWAPPSRGSTACRRSGCAPPARWRAPPGCGPRRRCLARPSLWPAGRRTGAACCCCAQGEAGAPGRARAAPAVAPAPPRAAATASGRGHGLTVGAAQRRRGVARRVARPGATSSGAATRAAARRRQPPRTPRGRRWTPRRPPARRPENAWPCPEAKPRRGATRSNDAATARLRAQTEAARAAAQTHGAM